MARQALRRRWAGRREKLLAGAWLLAALEGLFLLFGSDLVGWAYVGAAALGAAFPRDRRLQLALGGALLASGALRVVMGNWAGALDLLLAGLILTSAIRRSALFRGGAGPARQEAALSIATLGGFRLVAGGEDLTSSLSSRPVSLWLMLLLLLRALQSSTPLTRPELAALLAPGVPPGSAQPRLRRRLHDLGQQLPPALAGRLRGRGREIWLDLEGVDLDLALLRRWALAERQGGDSWQLQERAAAERALLSWPAGEFLPELERLQQNVAGPRAHPPPELGPLRAESRALFCSIALKLGKARLEEGEVGRADALFAAALRMDPESQEAARLLAEGATLSGPAAFRRTGAEEPTAWAALPPWTAAAAVALILAAGLGAGLLEAASGTWTAAGAAQRYYRELARGDAATAWSEAAIRPPAGANVGLLSQSAMLAATAYASQRAQGLRLTYSGHGTVTASYSGGGTESAGLERGGALQIGSYLSRWRLVLVPEPLTLRAPPGSSGVEIDGQHPFLVPPSLEETFNLLPMRHRITLVGSAFLATQSALVDLRGGGLTLVFSPRLTAAGKAAVRAGVDAAFRACAASNSPSPAGCPQSIPPLPGAVSWTLAGEPTFSVTEDPLQRLVAIGSFRMTAQTARGSNSVSGSYQAVLKLDGEVVRVSSLAPLSG